MWQVTATGTEGSTYVYQVDAPDYADQGSVFEAACRQHSQEKRSRGISENLDIRSGSYGVRLLFPQGHREKLDKILEQATEAGLTLSAEDIDWHDGEATIQGMDPDEWLAAM
ncbi:hypothetical protein QFZ22_003788 [Streptomyces canus]|uniref:DUF4265 domain-containing protein n=1 Tax=Streptomyces canus TaxID=58343 RepID=A0AAW8FE88_9ACTN|nr:hypothetical protein [Streptomyces canus]MDQ0907803.1 hypothetical protein [Streptomyces canus]